MCNKPKATMLLIDDGMENAALAMKEGELSLLALKTIDQSAAYFHRVAADLRVDPWEAVGMARRLSTLRDLIQAQLDLDCKDLELARTINQEIEVVSSR